MFETLTKGFRAARNRLAGVTELTEENIEPALRDVRLSLLEADVEFNVTKRFLARVKAEAIGQVQQVEVKKGQQKLKVGAAERFVKICQDELEAMMAFEGEAVFFAPKPAPTGIMMVGLQGAGKTTSAAKLARLLEAEFGRKVLLVAADVARPGAIEQLQVLGERIDVPVFSIPGGIPLEICKEGAKHAKKIKRDTVIFDTAGRLAIDEALMKELADIKAAVTPQNIFMVVDAMIGQDSVKTAKSFHEQLALSGVVLTKLDGDARGGAALSIKEATGASVRFVGMGEELDRLEVFRPDGMASRILGMGDVVGLMKDFESVVDQEKAEEDARRMLEGRFTFDDFLQQIEMIQNMGPLQEIFEKMPFFADSMPDGFQVDEKELGRTKAMVNSMTRDERRDPTLFQKHPSRLVRVAKGSGREAKDVAELIQRFSFMQNMMGSIGQQAGMLSKIPGMKQLAQANQLRNAVRTGGMESNPMMANLAEQLLEAAVAEGGLPPGMSGLPGMGGFPGMGGMGGMPGMGSMPGLPPGYTLPGMGRNQNPRKKVDKDKKKKERKQQKKSRQKSRK
ncbi:MAG: signal recognition particle protein [Sandaracinaceae bacterium]|nr:signal recognition particle protein [Myxococcales bacterium]MCB9662341.1 signal recognition particle protein [Sandaracinaceae bacterium]